METERTYRKVTGAEMFKAGHWITANWASILSERPSARVTCEKIKTELGIEMGEATLLKIVRDLGFEWPRSSKKSAGSHSGNKRDTSRMVAGWVAALYDKFGEPRPAGMTEFIAGKSFDSDAGPLFGGNHHPK